MRNRLFESMPAVFFKVLAATLGLMLLGWIGSIWLYGELSATDIAGSLICVPMVV